MNYLTYITRRLLSAVTAVYVVVTAMVVAMHGVVQNWVEGRIARINYLYTVDDITSLERQRRIDRIESTYDVETSLPARLLDWWVDVPTLDWRDSIVFQKPVTAVLDGRVVATMEYVLPGLVLAVVLGTVLGMAIAVTRSTLLDYGARLTAYAFFGVPVFMFLVYLNLFAGQSVAVFGVAVGLPDPGSKTLAALTVTVSLLAGQLRFTRASALEQRSQAFVKTLRAKGVGSVRMARHLLRNVAIPLVSLSITELLGTLVLAIYVVEAVLPIQGLGAVTLRAVRRADLPLVVGSTLIVAFLGIALSLLQDVLSGYLDPQIGAE